jgi:hypothetical protein
MKRYYAVEVTRTVTERRTIIACPDDRGAAHAPGVGSRTSYLTDQTTEYDWPRYVDVTP